jgi:hypothetical protein
VIAVPQRQTPPGRDKNRYVLRQIQGHRDGPQGPVRQAHGLAQLRIVVLAEEPAQRRETAAREQTPKTRNVANSAMSDPDASKASRTVGHA